MNAARKMYEPTPDELKKATKLLAKPKPAKWTKGKAAQNRWALMIVDSANKVPDAWLYYDLLAEPLDFPSAGESMWAAIDRLNVAMVEFGYGARNG